MKQQFNARWKRSASPSKQRKHHYTAPLHVKQKLMKSHLSPELRTKYHVRSIGVRKGDTVKVLRGQFSRKTGKVSQLALRRERLYIDGVESIKKDGTKVHYPLHPSKVMITELSLKDKFRKEKLERTSPSPTKQK